MIIAIRKSAVALFAAAVIAQLAFASTPAKATGDAAGRAYDRWVQQQEADKERRALAESERRTTSDESTEVQSQ